MLKRSQIVLIGLTSVVSQVVLLRELLIVFCGNELVIGTILAEWLLWVGAGSWGISQLPHRLRPNLPAFQSLVALILPLEIIFIRNIRNIAGAVTGEIFGFFPALFWSLLALAPLCLVLGAQFTIACQNAVNGHHKASPVNIGKVYFYECLGSILGGLLLSYILLYYLNSWHILLGVGALNLSVALWVSMLARSGRFFYQLSRGALAVALLLYAVAISQGDYLHKLSLRQEWRGYYVIDTRDSIYGNLVVTARGDQHSFFENGLLLFSTRDFAAEEQVHYPLLFHPKPQKVLLIGGGVAGSLFEVLKHPVNGVDYAELDPTLIKLAEDYLPETDKYALRDNRVRLWYLDGRLFVNYTSQKYDAVLLSFSHPFTAQLNRFYTLEFFQAVRRILREDGIVSVGIISAEGYPNKEMRNLNSCIYRTLKQVFGNVLVIPGDSAILLASPIPDNLEVNMSILQARFVQRDIETISFSPYQIPQRLSHERMEYALKTFGSTEARINRDFRPAGVYYDLILWSGYFSAKLQDLLSSTFSSNAWWLVLLLFLPFLVGVWKKRAVIPVSLAVLGFGGMVWEIMLVFIFQALYGYVYHQIALLITAFMVGLAVGSWWANQLMRRNEAGQTNRKSQVRRLAVVQLGVTVYALALPPIFLWMANFSTLWGIFIIVQIIFPVLTIVAGVLVGTAFPLASSVYHVRDKEIASTAGALYGADLIGSSFGAIVGGAFLIPILGISLTCLVVALLTAASCFFLLVRR